MLAYRIAVSHTGDVVGNRMGAVGFGLALRLLNGKEDATLYCVPLQSKFAMRTDTYQLQNLVIGLLINQHQVGFDVTVAEVFPVAR